MWHDMFSVQVPTLEKVLRTVLVYLLIAVLLRLSGKRGLAGMNTLDIVVIVLLSNVVQNAIIGNDNSVTGGAVGAVTLVAVNALLNRAAVLEQHNVATVRRHRHHGDPKRSGARTGGASARAAAFGNRPGGARAER